MALQAIEALAPLVARARRVDRDLGEQLRRALSSIVLDIGEGNRSEGGNRSTTTGEKPKPSLKPPR